MDGGLRVRVSSEREIKFILVAGVPPRGKQGDENWGGWGILDSEEKVDREGGRRKKKRRLTFLKRLTTVTP